MKTSYRLVLICVQFLCLFAAVVEVQAQARPAQRQVRTYVPPDQLVSFMPNTPFSHFITQLNPIFERVTRKRIVDPDSRSHPIGVSVSGMHFLDAFELVLAHQRLIYRETDQYLVLQPAMDEAPELVASARAAGREGAQPAQVSGQTREIQIDAMLFELNLSQVRELGVDWNTLFGASGGGGSAGGGESTGGGGEQPRFQVRTGRMLDTFSSLLTGPDAVDVAVLTRLLRAFEVQGIGETIANPQVTVVSGETGRIQVGSDHPILVRDFAGNTTTQFVQTGIIVEVLPTLLEEVFGEGDQALSVEFIHLDVQVEKSGGRPTFAGLVIDRNQANTQVLLLNSEQTIIGGLYFTEESTSRKGIPILKDLPGLRHVFGVTQRNIVQKELLIVMQARVVDPLSVRARRPASQDLRERQRQELLERMRRADPAAATRIQ